MKLQLLNALSKRFSDRSEDSIQSEIEALSDEKRSFFRTHNGFIRETRHELIDFALGEARFNTDRLMREAKESGQLNPATLPALAAEWLAVRDAGLIDGLHRSIDDAGDLSPLSKAEFEAKMAEFDSEIDSRRLELKRREKAAQLEEAERELANVGARAEA